MSDERAAPPPSSSAGGRRTTLPEDSRRDDAPSSAPGTVGAPERPDDPLEDTVPYVPVRSGTSAHVNPHDVQSATDGEQATDPGTESSAGTPSDPPVRRRWPRVLAAVLVTLLVLVLAVATVHLFRTSRAWQERADVYLADARGLGSQLATERAELAGARAELEAVRDQLATANARIVELADEKAQIGDDREVQRQLVDYQARVSEAAGQVAHALDQCVQGQQQLIGYLQQTVEGTAQYDPAELSRFSTDVETRCQVASEANISLQRELSR